MKVYYVISDSGDGSGTVHFYRNREKIAKKVEGDDYLDVYWMNEGQVREFEIPDGPNTIRFVD